MASPENGSKYLEYLRLTHTDSIPLPTITYIVLFYIHITSVTIHCYSLVRASTMGDPQRGRFRHHSQLCEDMREEDQV